jgi:hypothetical protein
VKHADGSATLKFAPTVDEICTDIRLLVVHLTSADASFKKPKKGFMPPGLSLLLEVLPLMFAIVMIYELAIQRASQFSVPIPI